LSIKIVQWVVEVTFLKAFITFAEEFNLLHKSTTIMKQKTNIAGMIIVGLLFFTQASFAQHVHKHAQEKKASFDLKSKLWYGGGLLLGYNSYYGSNVFSFGLSPMVGYKITNLLSAGPRVEISYASVKWSGSKAVSLLDVDAGAFVRMKVFRGLFVQGELSNNWYQEPIDNNGNKAKRQRFNQRLGAGWNFGEGDAGSEIGIFYNFAVAKDLNTSENPLGYRFGFTWNF
jgi:hypothetical protein